MSLYWWCNLCWYRWWNWWRWCNVIINLEKKLAWWTNKLRTSSDWYWIDLWNDDSVNTQTQAHKLRHTDSTSTIKADAFCLYPTKGGGSVGVYWQHPNKGNWIAQSREMNVYLQQPNQGKRMCICSVPFKGNECISTASQSREMNVHRHRPNQGNWWNPTNGIE